MKLSTSNLYETFNQQLGLYMKQFLILNELKTNLMFQLKAKFSVQNSLQSYESLFLIWCERLPICGILR